MQFLKSLQFFFSLQYSRCPGQKSSQKFCCRFLPGCPVQFEPNKKGAPRRDSLLVAYFFGSPYSRFIPSRVTSQIRPAFLASVGKNRGAFPLYPVHACCTVTGDFPQISAASAAVITSSSNIPFTPKMYLCSYYARLQAYRQMVPAQYKQQQLLQQLPEIGA